MKMRLFSLALLLVVFSCSSTDDYYDDQLAKFPVELVNHFPRNIDQLSYTVLQNIDTTSKCISLMLFVKNQDIKEPGIGKYIAKYQGADASIISIKRSTVTYWKPEKKVVYSSIYKGNTKMYPIPYFEKEEVYIDNKEIRGLFSDETASGLSKDFTIFVYESKPGLFWKGLSPSAYMPIGYRNGFSKGIAVNFSQRLVVHWVVIW